MSNEKANNDVTSTNNFTVTFPTPGSTTAVLTIS